MSNKTKIILVVATVILLVFILVAVYFSKSKTQINNSTTGVVGQGGTAVSQAGYSEQGLIYFDTNSQTFYLKKDEKSVEAIFKVGYQPAIILYSSDGAKILVAGDVADFGKSIRIIDVATKKAIELDHRILNAAFSPNGRRIAYHFYDEETGKSALYTSDVKNLNQKEVFNFGQELSEEGVFYSLRWIDNSRFLAFPVYPDGGVAKVRVFDQDSGEVTNLIEGNYADIIPGFNGTFAALLNTGEYNESNETSYELVVVDNEKTTRFTTIKTDSRTVSWDSSGKVLYAVGINKLGERNLYRIKDEGGLVEVIQSIPQDLTIEQVLLSKDGKSIILVHSGNLEVIKIN